MPAIKIEVLTNTAFLSFVHSVNTIALAKPEKAKMVENMLVQMAQSGQIQSKVWL